MRCFQKLATWLGTALAFAAATCQVGCGALPRLDRATLKVHSTSKPLRGADAKPNDPAPGVSQPTPPNPPPTLPNPAPPAPGPTPPVGPAPSVIIPRSFAATTGQSVAANNLTLVYGSSPAYERIEVRRDPGTTAPDCTGGTVVRELFKPFAGQLSFKDQTDTAYASYSYRACYYDSQGQVEASSDQPTATTKAHLLFVSTPNLTGNLGGADGAAALCRANAVASNLSNLSNEGSWQAVLSDSALQARERVQLLGRIVSTNASATQAAIDFAESGASLWASGLTATPPASILDNTGHASQSLVWSGSDGSGNSTGNTCSNWTTAAPMVTGDTGDATTLTGPAWVNGGAPTSCAQMRAVYCVAQPTPMLQAAAGATTAHSIDLTITPSDQWTSDGSIELRRRPYPGVPSSDCTAATETPILTVHPLSGATTLFNDDLASGSTPYNYRACLFDKNGKAVYSTLVLHVVSSP